jgi:hypothetical protein
MNSAAIRPRDQADRQGGLVAANRRTQVHLMRARIGRQTVQVADQIEAVDTPVGAGPAGFAEFGDPQHGRPGRAPAQRQPAGTARQRDPQQGRTIDQFAFALDRLGLPRQTIEVEASGKPCC